MLFFFIKIAPKKCLSFLVGHFSKLNIFFISKFVAFYFYKKYQIDLSIAEKTDIKDYSNLRQLFTRKLNFLHRPIAENKFWVHPADARLFSTGYLKENKIFQAKSFYYSLKDFLALDYLSKNIKEKYLLESKFKNAQYLDYYLCPTDYHRVHSPVNGKLLACAYIPGAYWPVNALSRSSVEHLFSKNERLIFYIQSQKGLVSLTMVGALCVGKIYNSISQSFVNKNYFFKKPKVIFTDNIDKTIYQGQELGIFYMGSTVICLLESSAQIKNFSLGQQTKIGSCI